MPVQTKNERDTWALFMNAPADEALAMLELAQKILIARCIIKGKRTRKPPQKETHGTQTDPK